MSSRRHLRALPGACDEQAGAARERSFQTSGLTIQVRIRPATGAGTSEQRERQLRAIVRLLRRSAALNAPAKRAA